MAKCPYTFPARTRKDMTAYLVAHETYPTRRGVAFSWNIKVPYGTDYSGHGAGFEFSERFDAEWIAYQLANDELFNIMCEDGLRQYLDAEWTNYPGIEQGEWRFEQEGRSGGHLLLVGAPSWAGNVLLGYGDVYAYLAELDMPSLRKLYRAMRVLDADLSRDAIRREMEYQCAFQREQWETDREAEVAADNAKLEAERPDLYALHPMVQYQRGRP